MRASLHGGLGIACSGYDRLKFAWFGATEGGSMQGFGAKRLETIQFTHYLNSARGVIHEE